MKKLCESAKVRADGEWVESYAAYDEEYDVTRNSIKISKLRLLGLLIYEIKIHSKTDKYSHSEFSYIQQKRQRKYKYFPCPLLKVFRTYGKFKNYLPVGLQFQSSFIACIFLMFVLMNIDSSSYKLKILL